MLPGIIYEVKSDGSLVPYAEVVNPGIRSEEDALIAAITARRTMRTRLSLTRKRLHLAITAGCLGTVCPKPWWFGPRISLHNVFNDLYFSVQWFDYCLSISLFW